MKKLLLLLLTVSVSCNYQSSFGRENTKQTSSLDNDYYVFTSERLNEKQNGKCHPDFDNAATDFIIEYIKYLFEDNQWIKKVKKEKGFWEIEDDNFPSISKFSK